MNPTPKPPKWNRGPSPKDGRLYHTRMRNCIGDEWESTALAIRDACNGWGKGKWQDWGGEVKAWRLYTGV
jgi:hypothetical protein